MNTKLVGLDYTLNGVGDILPINDNTYSYYHLDHLNYTKCVTDGLANIEVLYEYRAFGEQLKRHNAAGEETEDSATYTYGGKELDDETNLYYFNARYYDATTGRFINVDPVQDGSNWYVYCSNNPLSMVDPSGLTAEYEIDHDNNQINIKVEIEIYGDGANQKTADVYKKGIEDAWATDGSGNAWRTIFEGDEYQVNFDVSVKVIDKPSLLERITNSLFGTKNFVNADSTTIRSFVRGGSIGKWRSTGRGRKSLANDNPAAHEFGHILGFKDRYKGELTNPGWSGSIMGEPAMRGEVEQRNIDAIGNYLLKRRSSSGTLRSLFMRY